MLQTFLAQAYSAYDICFCVGLLVIAYLLGSIPFGLVLGKAICDKDIRQYGSKNIGSTNAIRVLGKKVGFLVFFCDVFKGSLSVLIAMALINLGAFVSPISLVLYGVAAIFGHSFSIFLEFKGGKAVATSLGVVFVLCPLAAITCLIVFGLTLKIWGYVSVSSTAAALAVVTTGWILYACGLSDVTNFGAYFIAKPDVLIPVIFSLITILIIVKHTKNYKRLLNGTENSFKKKKAN